MKKTKYIPILLICLLTVGGIIAISNGSFNKSVSAVAPSPTPAKRFYTTVKDMPDELMYGMLFLQISALETKDNEASLAGESSNFKGAFYENTLGLQQSQFATVTNAKNTALNQIQPIEQQARQVVENYRAQYPDGKLKKKPTPTPGKFSQGLQSDLEKLPPVPSQLQQLQGQKHQVIINAKNSIRQSLGTSEFNEFHDTLKKHYKEVLVPLNLGSRTPEPYPSPSN